jgi:hypothetical protein
MMIQWMATNPAQRIGQSLRAQKDGDRLDRTLIPQFGLIVDRMTIGSRVTDAPYMQRLFNRRRRPREDFKTPDQARVLQPSN